MTLRVLRVAILGAAIFAGSFGFRVEAQEPAPPGTMGIWLPALAELGFADETYGQLLGGAIFVFADEAFCDRFEVTEPTLLVVGAEGQPDPCRKNGARIELATGRGSMMFDTVRFKADSTVVFNNLAPWPSDPQYPPYVCAQFNASAIESVGCQTVRAPLPGASGNVGLTGASGSASLAGWLALAGVVLGVVALRTAVGHRKV